MTVEELIVYGKGKVSSTHAKMLLANLLNKNPLELLNYLNDIVDESIAAKYKEELEAIVSNQPIQYVIGTSNFYGNEFIVNENTLIPRFETEELVEKTLSYINDLFPNKNIDIVDLGTGTGCIGITLKKKIPDSSVTLIDISKEALEVARENAINNNTQVDIIQNDFLKNIDKKFDVIISNPPYIKDDEEIEEIVKNNEPHLALYAGIDGLDCYRSILGNIRNNLKEKYLIAFEIGCTQREAIEDLAKTILPEASIMSYEDMQGRDRMIFIYKK